MNKKHCLHEEMELGIFKAKVTICRSVNQKGENFMEEEKEKRKEKEKQELMYLQRVPLRM